MLLDWKAFSNQYLGLDNQGLVPEPNAESKSNRDNLKIDFERFSDGLDSFFSRHFESSKFDRKQACKTLKNYHFQKAGQPIAAKGAFLHVEKAQAIFEKFKNDMSDLRAVASGNTADLPRLPRVKKPIVLSLLSFCSATVTEQYIEPLQKEKVQTHFNRIEKINQCAQPVIAEENKSLEDSKTLCDNFQEITTLELLSKKFAYVNPQEDEEYTVFHKGRNIKYKPEVIHLWMGINAYGLKPVDKDEKDAPAILVFSGTRLAFSKRGSLATLTADFDPRGVGYIAYSYGKEAIEAWTKKAKEEGYNFLYTGHSLGGALARYAAIDNRGKAITFSAPGISKTFAEKYDGIPPDERPIVKNFNHPDDPIPFFGQRHVGENYNVIFENEPADETEQAKQKRVQSSRSIHSKKLFNRKISLILKTDPQISMSVCMQRALSIIPFIICMILLCLSRFLFGIHTSKPYMSLCGPMRWVWRQTITGPVAKRVAPATFESKVPQNQTA
jgi:hypothetical protein